MRSCAAILAATAACTLLMLPGEHAILAATRLDGGQARLLPPGAKVAVLFFVATDCPISNRYQPEILRLKQEFSAKGVEFWFVYPNLTETPSGIRIHRADFAPLDGVSHVLLDPGLSLVKLTGAKITPEAAILIANTHGELRPVYTGRIDDLYVSIGNQRPRATRHDLEDALASAVDGKPIPGPSGSAVGCSIVTVR